MTKTRANIIVGLACATALTSGLARTAGSLWCPAVWAQGVSASQPSADHYPNIVPTKLKAFIEKTPSVKIERHSLGRLTGRGTAEFFAVIARDPAKPEAAARGMEIELVDGTREARAYPDGDSLGEFELDTKRLAQRKDGVVREMQAHDYGVTRTWLSLVQNYARSPLSLPGEWADVPRVGWYGTDASHEIGVCILVVRRRGNGRYYFPGADLMTVVDFIAAGRKWLAAH